MRPFTACGMPCGTACDDAEKEACHGSTKAHRLALLQRVAPLALKPCRHVLMSHLAVLLLHPLGPTSPEPPKSMQVLTGVAEGITLAMGTVGRALAKQRVPKQNKGLRTLQRRYL